VDSACEVLKVGFYVRPTVLERSTFRPVFEGVLRLRRLPHLLFYQQTSCGSQHTGPQPVGLNLPGPS
jgi:hypothetical protein